MLIPLNMDRFGCAFHCLGYTTILSRSLWCHDDVIKYFPRSWPFVRGIHRSPVNSPYKGQWRGGLMFSLICAWMNDWINIREAGDLRRHRTHYDVTVMYLPICYTVSEIKWINATELSKHSSITKQTKSKLNPCAGCMACVIHWT